MPTITPDVSFQRRHIHKRLIDDALASDDLSGRPISLPPTGAPKPSNPLVHDNNDVMQLLNHPLTVFPVGIWIKTPQGNSNSGASDESQNNYAAANEPGADSLSTDSYYYIVYGDPTTVNTFQKVPKDQ